MNQENNVIIFNYWWTENYGALLTAYALQNLISRAYLANNKDDLLLVTSEVHNSFVKKFVPKYLNILQEFKAFSDYLKKQDNIYVTGSDQVFRVSTQNSNLISENLLDNVALNTKKIAFSASFGVNKKEFIEETPEYKIEHMKNSLKSFDFISVREKSGVEICKDILEVNAEWIIDPVFILDKSRYFDLIQSATKDYSNKIVSYILDSNKEYKKAYKYLSKQYQVNVVELANSNESVENWLKAIRDCKILITDSFHGMCFAIIFNKPFICIANKQRGATRFESVLEMLSIDYQCIDNTQEIYEKDCIFKVDYDVVNKRIKEERQRGLDYLKMALEAPVQVTQEKINARINFLEHKVCELEQQATLKYQIRKELWKLWLVIFHKYLPKPIKNIIRAVREKLCM